MRWLALVCVMLVAAAAGSAQADDTGGIVGIVTANPLSVALVVPPDPVRRGRWFRVVAEVTNNGTRRFDDVRVTLVRPQGLRLDPGARQTILRIPASETRRAVWQACSNTPGNYVLLARAEVGVFTAESAAAVVEITPSNRTC